MNYEVYGNYTLLEKLAMGGMAEVFLAKKSGVIGVDKFVAIKRILPQHSQQEEFIEMFKHEASIAINLSNSNIVSIFEFGLEKKQFYIVMDYVPGRNLRQILNHIRKAEVNLSVEHAIFIVREIAAGLDYAHRAMDSKTGKPLNIIHRDISPQNVMVSFEGEVRIVDFGIAKAESQTEATQAGTLKGKFGYMSPEQVEGLALDLRTDIFSLGILLWELLANDRLFLANNEQATIRKIRECKIPPLRTLNPGIPAELERIVNKALTRDRNIRYQAAAAMQKDLTVFLNKYFPMFTSQDFSGFMKKQFNAEILENRKKQMEYSSVKHERKTKDRDFDEVTVTSTNTDIPKPPKPPPPSKLEQTTTGSSELTPSSFTNVEGEAEAEAKGELNSGSQATFRENPRITKPHPNLDRSASAPIPRATRKVDDIFNTANLEIDQTSLHRSRSGRRSHLDNSLNTKSKSRKGTNPNVIYGAIAMAVCVLGIAFYNVAQHGLVAKYIPLIARCLSNPMTCNHTEKNNQDLASVAPPKIRIYINSNPPNARIYVENQPDQSGVKTTPDNIELIPNRPAKIIVKMDGFNDWEKTVSAETSETLTADLSKRRSAYLIANIRGAGDLYVNRKKYKNCNLVSPCAVDSDKEIVIEAFDIGTQTYDTLTLTLSDGETKQVVLTPKLTRDPNNSLLHPK